MRIRASATVEATLIFPLIFLFCLVFLQLALYFAEAINELSVLRDRFGGCIARAAIVSASKCQLITRNRAHELDIDVIDAEDLKRGRLPERLKSLARQFD